MRYFMPDRYLTTSDEEADAGFFALGPVVNEAGQRPARLSYAETIDGLRAGRLKFLIDVSGSMPPIDELWNEYLLVDPRVAEVITEFESQIEFVRTSAFDPDTQVSFEMILLVPRHDVAAYVGSEKLVPGKESDLDRTVAFTYTSGHPLTYRLSGAALAGRDIVRLGTAPQQLIAISEKFKEALAVVLPADSRHFDFREFSISDSAEPAARKGGAKKAKSTRKAASGAPAKRVTMVRKAKTGRGARLKRTARRVGARRAK